MDRIVNLGFGCASIMGRINKATSLKALDLAYEHGIRYFDTARSYGWGDGEKFLGEFLKKRKREDYFVTTKCGLLPQPRSTFKSFIRGVGRNIISSYPMSRKLVQGIAAKSMQPSSSFDLPSIKESFYTSLCELDIEYIDTLLLHNFSLNCNNINEILDLFMGFCKDGNLRKVGISTGNEYINEKLNLIDNSFLTDRFVLQIPSSFDLNLATKYNFIDKIIHSPFRPLSNGKLKQDRIDTFSKSPISLFKHYIDNINPNMIVCSMFNAEHIKQNISAIESLKTSIQRNNE